MTPQELAIAEFIKLAVEDARDDVNVSQAFAISRQFLSPASSPNAQRQRKLSELAHKIEPESYPDLERRFNEELSKVTHFESGEPFVRLPRFVLHVGPGLARYTRAGAFAGDFVSSTNTLREMASQMAAGTGTQDVIGLKGSTTLVAPEAMRHESGAAYDVMQAFAKVRNTPYAVLTVVCLGEGIISTLLNALVEVNLHQELAVCLHHADGAATIHRMDEEGFLTDWPYGVLNSQVSQEQLRDLGFTLAARK